MFSRGKDKVLDLLWSKEWTGAASNLFTGTVFDGTKRIGKIVSFSNGSTSVTQTKDTRTDYDMTTTIQEDGKVSVTFMGDNYFQNIEIRGRNTRLIDDLEYTKSTVMIERVGRPWVDALEDELGKKKSTRRQK